MSSANLAGDNSRQRSAAPPPGATGVDLSFALGELHALRSTVAAHAARYGIPDAQVDRVVIVAIELTTNAIRHGGGSGSLRMWCDDGILYCQVSDDGPGLADYTAGNTRPDPTATNAHRGLWICRNLAGELTFAPGRGGRGLTVTASFRIPGQH